MTRSELPNQNRRGSKPPARLGAKLEQALLAYASAATSAGVALLALTSPAEARIVYTKANEQIFPEKFFHLNLNHAKPDFTFDDSGGSTSFGGAWGILTIFPNHSRNQIWGYATSQGFTRMASALAAGVQVGPSGMFSPGERIMLRTSVSGAFRRGVSTYYCRGPWKNATNRYLGLKFIIDGEVHYGWARLNVSCANVRVSGTLTGYAYETVPNKPIVTGKTKGEVQAGGAVHTQGAVAPTLGRLAQGSAGVSAWRDAQEAQPASGRK
jgi:hypothetical protein